MVYLPCQGETPEMVRDLLLSCGVCASTARFVGLAQVEAHGRWDIGTPAGEPG
jgi:hypothetical protein